MGNRENLLEGAKRCLYERGYARTTARDIVNESGTNLASIGYHYGSKDALLDEALISIATETDSLWGTTADISQSFPDAWDRMLEDLASHQNWLVGHTELWCQMQRSPALKEKYLELASEQRAAAVQRALEVKPDLDQQTAEAVTSLSMAIGDGLVVQLLADQDLTINGSELPAALRALADYYEDAAATANDED
ncbi:MAG TPA: TetR/AcrR family transcriptional regulator [Candidatus Corynebacterium avicola]|uniref:TetR/AcrR family transcriptional regulator n=1 Tax=Candidatus Corynebacterium avicola TaxID=2838527 RepID=A0A9D1RNG5_9CORY|nr:TetR/AcrR family transcriptional regulator [Candidatus Corynebacterium avicola]